MSISAELCIVHVTRSAMANLRFWMEFKIIIIIINKLFLWV